jgi:hypothetical protein
VGAFVKHANRRFGDVILVDAHRGAGPVWEEALRRSGLAGRGELHGAVSRALALYLAPGTVTEGAYGERVPERMGDFADYVGWERIVPDGSWGRYEPAADEGSATAEAGRILIGIRGRSLVIGIGAVGPLPSVRQLPRGARSLRQRWSRDEWVDTQSTFLRS